MKALIKIKPKKGLSLSEKENPKIHENDEVIIETLGASICGTDLHIYEWDEWISKRMKLPKIIGHEVVGKIIEVGKNVKGLTEGDIVAAESHVPCLNCYYCKTGRMHICKNLKVLGVDIDGCFAEEFKTKSISLWKLNIKINYEYASVLEPLGNAVHAIFEAEISGKNILVYGCGPIGLATIFLCKKLGATNVIGVDISEYRLNLAKKMGADFSFNPKEKDIEKEILEITYNEGIDVLFEMSGANEAFTKGLKLLKSNSIAIFFGIPSKEVKLDISENIIFKETIIKGIFGRKMFDTWYKLEEILRKYSFPFDVLLTHKFKLENYKEAFETLKEGKCGKILIKI